MSRIAIVLGSALIAAITLSTIVIVLRSASDSAEAGTPSVDFAIGIDINSDGTNDCGTGVPSAVGDGAPDAVAAEATNTTCNATLGGTLAVNVYLIDNGGIAYVGQASEVYYTGIMSPAPSTGSSVWTGCFYAVTAPTNPAYEIAACTIGPYGEAQYPAAVTNLGLMTKFVFTCAASGTIHLGKAAGETGLTDEGLTEHRDAGSDELAVNCGDRGTPTPTPTPTPCADANCAGTQFAIGIDTNGDGVNDCGTGVPLAVGDGAPEPAPIEVTNKSCDAPQYGALAVRVYLIGNPEVTYNGHIVLLLYTGIESKGRGVSVSSDCVFYNTGGGPGHEEASCLKSIDTPEVVSGVGLLTRFAFTCSASGTLSLSPYTILTLPPRGPIKTNPPSGAESGGGVSLTVNCRAPTPPPAGVGDANCDGVVSSVDAMLILQRHAGLIAEMPCDAAGDVQADGNIDSRDAELILQYVAGLCQLLGACS